MISTVRKKGSYIEVYDTNNKRISEMSAENKNIVGFASSYFVITNNLYIEVYNEQCKRISRMEKEGCIVINTMEVFFYVHNVFWLETYDKNCRVVDQKIIPHYYRKIELYLGLKLNFMTKEIIIAELNKVTEQKLKAVAAQSYELASRLRDKEKELMKQLEVETGNINPEDNEQSK